MRVPALTGKGTLAPIFLLAAVSAVLLAQQPVSSGTAFKGQRVTGTAAKASSADVMPAGPAKVCLTPSGMCFTAPDHDPPFGFSPTATVVQLGSNRQALLFTTIASASGSGSTKLLTLLDIRNGHLENLLPGVTISEQGEYKLWLEPTISKTALLVTADYVSGAGETHFSPHRFKIKVYDLSPITPSDPRLQSYHLRDEYITGKKYPSLDDADTIAVLDPEKPEVLAHLRRQR